MIGTPQPQPVVFVVDDDVSVRESLDLLIRHNGLQTEIFGSAEEFLAHERTDCPSCLILDLALPDLDGLGVQKCVAKDQPFMPIIFITGHGDVPTSVQAMKAGAFEFLTKPLESDALLEAIRRALERSQVALNNEAATEELRQRYATLTKREREVMALVVDGLLNKQIGARLGTSEITVKAHRGRVMRKMCAESLADLVKVSQRLRL